MRGGDPIPQKLTRNDEQLDQIQRIYNGPHPQAGTLETAHAVNGDILIVTHDDVIQLTPDDARELADALISLAGGA